MSGKCGTEFILIFGRGKGHISAHAAVDYVHEQQTVVHVRYPCEKIYRPGSRTIRAFCSVLQWLYNWDSTSIRPPFDCLSKVIKITVT